MTESPQQIAELRIAEALETGAAKLNLADLSLDALPEAIGKLTALQSLNLGNNQLSALPEAIGKLTALQSLNLWGNQLSALPEAIGKLTALQELYLHGNSGLSLPPDVLGPEMIEVLRDKKQPAAPADILAFYFRSRSEATRPLHLAKILIVGQAAVGKTSLVRRLKGESFDEHERATEGISIADWSVPLEGDAREGDVKVKVWDFGGQEVMHATHQFFLTKRSLYLVVLDARRGEDDCRLHYWLKIVESYGGGSPVIVVINKCEPPHWLELNERRLRTDYPSIRQFLKVSCASGTGIGELRQLVEAQVRELPHVADAVPTSFFDLKRDLESRTKDYLTFAEYQEACRAHGIERQQDQKSFLRILHALGSMLNYDDPEILTHCVTPMCSSQSGSSPGSIRSSTATP
jgi:internalin A